MWLEFVWSNDADWRRLKSSVATGGVCLRHRLPGGRATSIAQLHNPPLFLYAPPLAVHLRWIVAWVHRQSYGLQSTAC